MEENKSHLVSDNDSIENIYPVTKICQELNVNVNSYNRKSMIYKVSLVNKLKKISISF